VRSSFSATYAVGAIEEPCREGAMQQTAISFISVAAAADDRRYPPFMFRHTRDLMSHIQVDEGIALLEEMYTRICEENGPHPVLQGIVSHSMVLAESGGD
jgi:hypothetical protein